MHSKGLSKAKKGDGISAHGNEKENGTKAGHGIKAARGAGNYRGAGNGGRQTMSGAGSGGRKVGGR